MRKSVILLLFCISCSKHNVVKLEKHHVDATLLKYTNSPYTLTYPALIGGDSVIKLVPQVTGMIKKQLYDDGSFVHKGQNLYNIDNQLFKIQLNAAKAKRLHDALTVNNYKLIVSRYKSLANLGGISNQQLNQANINYHNAISILQNDDVSIANARSDINHSFVKSPVSGYISSHLVPVGNVVNAYQTELNQIVDSNNLYVKFTMPNSDRLFLLQSKQENTMLVPKHYAFKFDIKLANGKLLKDIGIVNFVDNKVDSSNGVLLKGKILNMVSLHLVNILAGQFVTVILHGAYYHNVFLLPTNSLLRDSSGSFVYTVDSNNMIHKKKVVVSSVLNTTGYWVVKSGLSSSDIVVTNGGIKVSDGEDVIVDHIAKIS